VLLAAPATLMLVGPASYGATAASTTDCVPRSVIDSVGPDGLPPLGSVVTSTRENRELIRTYSGRISRTYPDVLALSSGPGWGRAWRIAAAGIAVVPVRDFAILVTVRRPSDCPAIPGYAAGLGRATLFFRYLASEHAGAECRAAASPKVGSPDALPVKGQTVERYVRRVLRSERGLIARRFGGVVSMRVAPRNGDVWTRDTAGAVVTSRARDFWIVVQLESNADCPAAPEFWNGVPLEFVVGR
jgi:hypothetical protein